MTHNALNLRFFKGAAVLGLVGILAACVSPQQAEKNRATRLEKQFPNPADRVGMFIVFPSSDQFTVSYVPSQVSQFVALRRIDQLCAGAGLGTKAVLIQQEPAFSGQKELGDGTSINVRAFSAGCA